ncbi:MAG: transglutaminase family protein [Bryobacteraceae bacterium]|jgi:transglutaminase-like putative cysteine protease
MLIRLGYDIQFDIPEPAPMVAMLHVHPSRIADLRAPDELQITPAAPVDLYHDSFGNICSRFVAPAGQLRLYNSTLIEDSGVPDRVNPGARQAPVEDLPSEVLQFLLASRYCEVDKMVNTAGTLFGGTIPGWSRVQAICDWVQSNITFGYNFASPTMTAQDVFRDRRGVCRDFQHLAITFCRAMNIPARYATGYLGDIGVPLTPPMDFSAWFEAYLEDHWWTFDARNNVPRIGRVLMATGRDAADVAITTSFGTAWLKTFTVVTDEVTPDEIGTGSQILAGS